MKNKIMKRGFIRGLWGIHENTHRVIARRFRTDNDIKRIMNCKFNEPFKTYVMGKDNYEGLKALGFDCLMISEEPQMFDLVKYQFRNKLEIIKYAMEKDDYDQIVYLDWDCVPVAPLPDDFWDVLERKGTFQACLQLYHRRKCHWRKGDMRKVPNGGFMYIADKNIPEKAIKLWEETGKNDSDEIAWAKMTDNLVGGWKGSEFYWNKFEPDFCNLHKASSHPDELINTKNICFIHYQG